MLEDMKITDWSRNPADPQAYSGGLIEMPDGSWIDPARITRVVPLDRSNEFKIDAMPRCVVHLGEHDLVVIECSDLPGAKDLARWFALMANTTRRG
ncbi:hypothetical protein [Thalassobaculum litoreum]|uniref:Uncharacterized protein n=1 Tax=Thalassobaculum litoreum DSM 18839 TaxID=1123362 RepID=A0A8G2BI35_9PROT|nr:hypothetical protein [Thalassobaculum litoreum]SDF84133.1 hypothetical protein SAMN05660686_02497 [Thalassobaculum litoreum DSM 18839]